MCIKRIVKQLMWAFCVSCLMSSCIKEDLPACFTPNVGLRFSYTLNVSGKDRLSEEVQSIDVYVFNADGLCVDHQRVSNRTFDKDYVMLLQLDPGVYDFVAWANLDEKDYILSDALTAPFVVGKSYKKDAIVHLKNEQGVVSSSISHLFYGMTSSLTVGETADINYRTVALVKDANTLNIKLEYIGTITQGSDFMLELKTNNGHMYFDNSLLATLPPIIYYPYSFKKSRAERAEFTSEILRLRIDLPTMLRIVNLATGRTLFNEDLTKLILKTGDVKTNNDFDRIDQYDIMISFGKDTEAMVTINHWVVKQPESDLEYNK